MREAARRLLPVLVLLPLSYLLGPILWAPLDYRFYNYFHAMRPVPPWTRVLVVGIDRQTRDELFAAPVHPLAGHGNEHARVARRLAGAGASKVVFDLEFGHRTFAEPPRELAAAFTEAGNVHLIMTMREERIAGEGGGTRSLLAGRLVDSTLAAASQGAFVVNVEIDPDGCLRRFRSDPRLASMGLETLPERLAGFRARGSVPIVFPSLESPIPLVSYRDVHNGDPEALAAAEGRIVFVGLVKDDGTDVVAVPRLQPPGASVDAHSLPGVIVLAAITETLLRGAPILDANFGLTLAWTLLCCLAVLGIPPRTRPIRALLTVAGLLLIALTATALFQILADLVFPAGLLFGSLLLCGAYTLVSSYVETTKRLHAEEIEKARVQHEMAAARRMQERFLPKAVPAVPGLDLWGTNISSLAVSGDYFDLIDLGENGPLLLTIADVSGKGLPASLLMSNVQAGLHSHTAHQPFDLRQTAEDLNRLVCENTDAATFVTFFLAEIDKRTHRLRYVRAGHDCPLLISAAQPAGERLRRLEDGGLFLGMMPGAQYEVAERALGEGDVLCLYTDGITEARSPDDEEFGVERLGELLESLVGERAEAIGEGVVQAVRDFSGLERQADDITLVILKLA